MRKFICRLLAVAALVIASSCPILAKGAEIVIHGEAASPSAHQTSGVATTTEQEAVGDGKAVRSSYTTVGKQIIQPYSARLNNWRYVAASGGLVSTTGVMAKNNPPSGSRNCVTAVQIINTNASTSTSIEIRDGTGGPVMWRGWAQAAGGGISAVFPTPICGTNTTLIEIAESVATTTNGVLVNLQGYVSAE